MNNIWIYQDDGVSKESVFHLKLALKQIGLLDTYKIHKAIANDFHKPIDLNQVALIIFPGGRDVPYQKKLQNLPNTYLRNYIKEGGKYLGICAGAYYACSQIEFAKGQGLQVIADRELHFFPGKAVGPIFNADTFCYFSHKGAKAVSISSSSTNSSFHSFFNGGCYFELAGKYPLIEVLASYEDHPQKHPAAIECKIEKGKAILCGFHPEYCPQMLRKTHDKELYAITSLLDGKDRERKDFFKFLLLRLISIDQKK